MKAHATSRRSGVDLRTVFGVPIMAKKAKKAKKTAKKAKK